VKSTKVQPSPSRQPRIHIIHPLPRRSSSQRGRRSSRDSVPILPGIHPFCNRRIVRVPRAARVGEHPARASRIWSQLSELERIAKRPRSWTAEHRRVRNRSRSAAQRPVVPASVKGSGVVFGQVVFTKEKVAQATASRPRSKGQCSPCHFRGPLAGASSSTYNDATVGNSRRLEMPE
jgi:hypothetical protein